MSWSGRHLTEVLSGWQPNRGRRSAPMIFFTPYGRFFSLRNLRFLSLEYALSGTVLSGLHHKQRWLALRRSLVERESVRESARRCGVAVTTAFRWRHRFMAQAGQLQGRLEGLVEADETYVSQRRHRRLIHGFHEAAYNESH